MCVSLVTPISDGDKSWRFSNKDRITSSRPDFVLVTPFAAKTQKQQTNVGKLVLRSGMGQIGETGSTPAAVAARCKRHTRDVKITYPWRNCIPYIWYIRPTLMCLRPRKLITNKQTRGFYMIACMIAWFELGTTSRSEEHPDRSFNCQCSSAL